MSDRLCIFGSFERVEEWFDVIMVFGVVVVVNGKYY